MDATLKGILTLLAQSDPETRCAALVVLTGLKNDDPKVVEAVEQALAARNTVVRDFALGYLETVRPRSALAAIVGFLDHEDSAVRQRAVALLGEYGPPAIVAARRGLKDAPRRRLNAILELAARIRSTAAFEILFEQMSGTDFEANRTACDALLAVVPALADRERAELFEHCDRLAAGAKDSRPILVAAARLFGALGEARARKRLFAQLDHPDPSVRTHALGALLQCLRGQKLAPAEIESLLPLLDGDDENGILRPAVRLLEDQSLDRSYLTRLNRLAESPQPLVKRFAIQKLSAFESGNVVKTLIGYLTDDSYARRDQAASSLKTMPGARNALMKELLESEDERAAWTLSEILLAHDRSWKRDVLTSLATKLERALEKREDRLHTAYFHFLNTIDPDAAAAKVRERAEQLRKSKKFPLAARWLGLLRQTPAFDDEAKYALAIAELKSHRLTITSGVRRNDPLLEPLRALAPTRFPLGERLRKERVLTPEDFYYISFHFAEGTEEERELARELLELLVAKHGRTKLGKAAKNKLELVKRSLGSVD